MKDYYLDYSKTGYFSKSMLDLVGECQEVEEFVFAFSNKESFKNKISDRDKFPINRKLLHSRLELQNENIIKSELTNDNINKLQYDNSYTITTGHQLSLFTGQLYFIYKIASIIKLSQELKQIYPEYNFIPLFWLASEDHDFDEIKSFKFNSDRFNWNEEASGPVGRLSVDSIKDILPDFRYSLGEGKRADYLVDLFGKAYLEHESLAEATRFLVNELFGEYGVVILDGDDKLLKSEMKNIFKKELIENTSDKNIKSTNIKLLEKGYKAQVGHREINLFYIKDNLRERIVKSEGGFKILNTNITFSNSEILKELENYPERFSPNAVMRPMYEEKILPNLAYVGGGGELAYWMQLKSNFEEFELSYPILVLRNSLMYMSSRQEKKAESLDVSFDELFLSEEKLIEEKIDVLLDYDLSESKTELVNVFDKLKSKGFRDKSIVNSIEAYHHKQQDMFDALQKKIRRAERKIHSDKINKIKSLKMELFPSNGLQERVGNFSELYMEFGDDIIENLIDRIAVLDNKFTILIND